jgi:hypothetical protein
MFIHEAGPCPALSSSQGEAAMTNRTMKAIGVAALATGSLMMMATSTRADVKDRSTVAKESAKLTQAIAKTLQKYEQAVHDGKLAGSVASGGAHPTRWGMTSSTT